MWNIRTLLLTLVLALMVGGGAAQAAESSQYASGVNEVRLETGYDFDFTHRARSGGFTKTLTRNIGPGFKLVDVELLGWELAVGNAVTIFGTDRHLAVSEVKITDVSYNPGSGTVSFQVSGIFRDKDLGDSIGWRVDYAVLALR